jgi:hypothetical protein
MNARDARSGQSPRDSSSLGKGNPPVEGDELPAGLIPRKVKKKK